MKKIFLLFAFITIGFLSNLTLAASARNTPAPIEDLSDQQQVTDQQEQDQQLPSDDNGQQNQNQDYNPDTSYATADERLNRVEQQVRNITHMNMPQRIDELRQEVQQLTGQIQVQQNEIKKLETQQRSFYQDLNNRIQKTDSTKKAPPSAQKQSDKMAAKVSFPGKGLNDSAAYRSAFNLLLEKKYDDALNSFQSYISEHPRGAYVPNAYYWMGELYLKRDDTEMAIKSFSKIVSKYSNSNKVPDAKLKLAMIHIKQGKRQQARQEFRSIKQRFPNSTAAQLASIQLQRMEP